MESSTQSTSEILKSLNQMFTLQWHLAQSSNDQIQAEDAAGTPTIVDRVQFNQTLEGIYRQINKLTKIEILPPDPTTFSYGLYDERDYLLVMSNDPLELAKFIEKIMSYNPEPYDVWDFKIVRIELRTPTLPVGPHHGVSGSMRGPASLRRSPETTNIVFKFQKNVKQLRQRRGSTSEYFVTRLPTPINDDPAILKGGPITSLPKGNFPDEVFIIKFSHNEEIIVFADHKKAVLHQADLTRKNIETDSLIRYNPTVLWIMYNPDMLTIIAIWDLYELTYTTVTVTQTDIEVRG